MNKRYKVCPLFWSDYGDERTLMNMGVFEKVAERGLADSAGGYHVDNGIA